MGNGPGKVNEKQRQWKSIEHNTYVPKQSVLSTTRLRLNGKIK